MNKKWGIAFVVLFSINQLSAQKLEIIGGYFPYWKAIGNTDFSQYNYLYYAFAYPTKTGGLQFLNSDDAEFLNFKHSVASLPSKKFISIGSDGMSIMAADSSSRLSFADTLRRFCNIHKFSGIDIDWEAIDNDIDRSNFTALINDIRNTIDSTNLELSITVGFGDYWLQWYENEALIKADFLQIMVYDQTGTWAESPFGNHASLEHFKQAESYWLGRGFSRDKLVMGLPYYGYKFNNTSGGLATAVPYSEIVSLFPNIKSNDNYLSIGSEYYWFNGADLIKEKVRYALYQGFKGVFVWELSQDNFTSGVSLNAALKSVITTCNLQNKIRSEPTFSIYPNPCNELLYIKFFDNSFKNGVALFYSSLGELLFQLPLSQDLQVVDVKKLPKGLLFVQVIQKSGVNNLCKVVMD